MRLTKRMICWLLTLTMLISCVPGAIFAQETDVYSITNGYLTYTMNSRTGGFSIETAEGHPYKDLDDNIPLLYMEDESRSNGTSFVTVRIDDKDYIFGQDYGFFGLDTQTKAPVISDEGRLITVEWTIKGITVIKKVALGTDMDSDLTGNAGISFEAINNSGAKANVGIRLLLDTALGSKIDAPYVVVDEAITPIFVEEEFSGDQMPGQIRNIDSLSKPGAMSYLLLTGWDGGENNKDPNKLIAGHWANMANTRYDYNADEYCDFTNYSNSHRTPDAAVAVYWDNNDLENGESFVGQTLYGVGNFSNMESDSVGLNVTADRVELTEDKDEYVNDGIIEVDVEIDNTLTNSRELTSAALLLRINEEDFEMLDSGTASYEKIEAGDIKTNTFRLKAKKQQEITAGEIYVSITATETGEDGTQKTVEALTERAVILPSTSGKKASIQLTQINPGIVYMYGVKGVTISGSMKPFEALSANQGWDLRLYHEKTGESLLIPKKDISFLDDEYTNMSFTIDKDMDVGKYDVVFEFEDNSLVEAFGKSIKVPVQLEVSNDPIYALKSYGIMSLVRTTKGGDTDYDFFAFGDEGEYKKFYDGELSKSGLIRGEAIRHSFGAKKDSITEHEIIVTVRGNIREMEREGGGIYWQANPEDGDVIINNMLSYEGDSPLELYCEGGVDYVVEGDGLLKVVNSITVWRSEWELNAAKGIIYTLDESRLSAYTNLPIEKLNLTFGGAAVMIQSIGGFLVDLKYGEMYSDWHEDSGGNITYGIGFGGSIALPISPGANKEESDAILTADQEDVSDSMQSMFDDGESTPQTQPSPTVSQGQDLGGKVVDKYNKASNFDGATLSADVNNVLFGEKWDDDNEAVSGTGFVGIDTTVSLGLPKDLLGSLVNNAPGVEVSMTINTIQNIYQLYVGLNIKIIECEGILAFKEVNIKGKDAVVPDRIEFHIRDGLMIPLVPPVLYIAGLGGGVSGLADTMGGNFSKLPPITLILSMRLTLLKILDGQFDAQISLEGLSLEGKLMIDNLESLLLIEAGISARWVEPWSINLYGQANVIDGIITGGISVTVADDYFYGYIFASLCIPDSIPVIGGKEVGRVEAAVSDEFIGANIKVIGLKFGVIYYWGKNVSFGSTIDLSPPSGAKLALDSLTPLGVEEDGESGITGYYGTNVHPLSAKVVSNNAKSSGASLMGGEIALLDGGSAAAKSISASITGTEGKTSLLVEFPYTGNGYPGEGELVLINPDGRTIEVEPDDGEGGGNFLVQDQIEGGKYIYISVTDSDLIKDGIWTLEYASDNVEITTVNASYVDDIPELVGASHSYSTAAPNDVEVSWDVSSENGKTGNIDVYLTKDKDIVRKLQSEKNQGNILGDNLAHLENINIADGSTKVKIPVSYESGTYYVLVMFSTDESVSLKLCDTPIDFVNPKSPKAVAGVNLKYGGNNNLYVEIEDTQSPDYTHYLVEIRAADGTVVSNNLNQYSIDDENIFIGAFRQNLSEEGISVTDESLLIPGKEYSVAVRTLREETRVNSDGSETKEYYYGDMAYSNPIVMPESTKPVLKSVKANFDTSKENINTNDVVLDYEFENPVWMELNVRGTDVFSDDVFKTNWRFELTDLPDGDYYVDFTAYSEGKDYVTGADLVSSNPDAQLGFTIDTSAPVLSLAQRSAKSLAEESGEAVMAVFGTNTVFADDTGSYTISGITEAESTITVNGSTEGVRVEADGTFTYTGSLPGNEIMAVNTILVVDKAGNESKLIVYAVNEEGAELEEIKLYANGVEIDLNDEGVPEISIRNGETVEFTAVGIAGEKEIPLANDIVEWSILYEKAAVALSDGTVTAMAVGESAVKVKLKTSSVETTDGKQVEVGLESYVIVKIENNNKDDLQTAIENAEKTLSDNASKATEAEKLALQNAIDEATLVLNNSAASADEITKAVTDLNAAVSTFKKAVSGGKGGGGGGGSTYYKVEAAPAENGTVTLSHSSAKKGTSVTVTAVPDEGYEVADIVVNGVSVGNTSPYTLASVTQNTTIRVTFKPIGAKAEWNPFIDVSEKDWFHDFVKAAYESDLMVGTSASIFDPNGNVTRAMFVSVLYRMEGEPEAQTSRFTDVKAGSWYEKAVAWASENAIVYGISDTEYAPDDNITREQMAAILYRYAQFRGVDVSQYETTDLSGFEDAGMIADYALSAMKYVCGVNIIMGVSDTSLAPKGISSRAQAATVLTKMYDLLK